MLCVNCSSELGEAGKWRHSDDEDRLSNLPEPILYHILSFLDTKSAVRTSKLSRVWNRLWKHVSVLDLRQDCFGDDPYPFEKFVDKVLSVRYPVKLHKLTYVMNFAPWSEDHTRMFAKVIKYAFSHDAQHLVFDTGSRCQLFDRAYRFSSLFHSYPTRNQFVTRSKTSNSTFNLKTLELRGVALDSGFLLCSRLPMLTTLKVKSCLLLGTDSYTNEPKDCLDLFSNFPGLVNLAISDCYLPADSRVRPFLRVRMSGLQLLSLELEGMEKIRIEIFAPKLRFFSVRQDVNDSQGFSELSLPSLDRAEIELNHIHRKEAYAHHDQYLNALFQGLHNAKSLKLGYSTVSILKQFLDDQQPCPIKGLESLIVPWSKVPLVGFLFDDFRNGMKMDRYTIKALPMENGWKLMEHLHKPIMSSDYDVARWDKVMDYFFKESSCKEPKVLVDFSTISYFVIKRLLKP